MPGALDDTLRTTAQNLIERFGKSVPLTRVTRTFDRTVGKTTASSESTSTITIAPLEPYEKSAFAGTLVKKTNAITLVAAKAVAEPTEHDYLTIDGVQHQIGDVGTLWSGSLAAVFVLGLNR